MCISKAWIKSSKIALMAGICCVVPIGTAHAADNVTSKPVINYVPPNDFDDRHISCLELIAKDADFAYEEAMIWQSQGGGRRARHCVAMALFAVGHADEAAFRMEKLAKSADGGTPTMRAEYYAQSVDFWLAANLPRKALSVANVGIKIAHLDMALRLQRARAYAALDRWDYAEIDLSSVIDQEPLNAKALRYRADARLRQEKLILAKSDIERAIRIDGGNIDALLIRGKIREAKRLEPYKSLQPVLLEKP